MFVLPLQVQPFAGIIEYARPHIPRILFNMEPVGPFKRPKRSTDFTVKGIYHFYIFSFLFVNYLLLLHDGTRIINEKEIVRKQLCVSCDQLGVVDIFRKEEYHNYHKFRLRNWGKDNLVYNTNWLFRIYSSQIEHVFNFLSVHTD